jgi:hypothetical protein
MGTSNGATAPAGDRVRLGPGRHSSPAEGACVVELASVLAGERFSDRPRCVCPVIAAFLRGWNDRAAYADRQRLRPYARRIVGTRAGRRVTRKRRDACLEWVGAGSRGGPARRLLTRVWVRFRIAVFCGIAYARRFDEGAAEYAARVLYGRRDVVGAFALLDLLLAIGREDLDRTGARAGSRNGAAPPNEIATAPPVTGAGASRNGAGKNGSPARSPELERV